MDVFDVAILGDGRWHADSLTRAFARLGLEARRLRWVDLRLDATAPGGIAGPFAALPRAVVVRGMPGGSFERMTLRLGLLRALEATGVFVANPARAIEACTDKSEASLVLRRAGLPTPDFWCCESGAAARLVAAREASPQRPLVAKPLFGAQGRGLRLVYGLDDLPGEEEVAGVWYLQRYVERPGWFDLRLFVVDGRVVAAMRRENGHWITNVHQGGRGVGITAPPELAGSAVAAARALGTFFAGVDVAVDVQGRPWILEVNAMPAWKALQAASGVDVAAELAAAVARRIGAAP